MASKLYDYSKDELQKLLDESNSYADLLRKLEMSEHGANRTTLKKVIDEYNLDLTQISRNREMEQLGNLKRIWKTIPLENILKKDTSYTSAMLLKRLFVEGYKEKKCERCGIVNWMGEEITFHLHHKDGKHNNNELENLQVLCPNCHSQTENYAGKGVKKIPKLTKEQEKKKAQYGISEDGQRFYDGYGNYKKLCPICKTNFMHKDASMCRQCYDKQRKVPKISKEELFEIMETNSYYSAAKILGVKEDTISHWHKYYLNEERKNGNLKINSDKAPIRNVLKQKIRTLSFVQIGKEYGVSDNTIRKWCDVYGLPKSAKIIKQMSDEEWDKI